MKKSNEVFQPGGTRRQRWYETQAGPTTLANLRRSAEEFQAKVEAEQRKTGAAILSYYEIQAVGNRIRISVLVELPQEENRDQPTETQP